MSAAVSVLLVGVLPSMGCTPGVTEEELAKRCETSQPSWQNYPEDIKAQVGAGPIAEWEGSPSEAQYTDGIFRVTFTLRGAWVGRAAGVPVLLQEPTGGTHRNATAACAGEKVTYSFDLSKTNAASTPAWVELKYPHATKRISLSERADWRAPAQ